MAVIEFVLDIRLEREVVDEAVPVTDTLAVTDGVEDLVEVFELKPLTVEETLLVRVLVGLAETVEHPDAVVLLDCKLVLVGLLVVIPDTECVELAELVLEGFIDLETEDEAVPVLERGGVEVCVRVCKIVSDIKELRDTDGDPEPLFEAREESVAELVDVVVLETRLDLEYVGDAVPVLEGLTLELDVFEIVEVRVEVAVLVIVLDLIALSVK